MRIEILKLKELKNWFYSDEIQSRNNLAINSLRLVSQINNPAASQEDEVLITAFDDENNLLAYFGCLPTKLNNYANLKICFSSCWWKDPSKAGFAASKVLLTSLQLWNKQMLFDDLPVNSKIILEKMNDFSFTEYNGVKCFLNFDLSNQIPNRFPSLKFLKGFLSAIDKMTGRIKNLFQKVKIDPEINIERVQNIDKETSAFINKFSEDELFSRSADELNWILKYPWMSNKKEKYSSEAEKYHFSMLCDRFENLVYKVFRGEKLIAFVWFSNRDSLFKMPYIYYDNSEIENVTNVIKKILIANNANALISYQSEINNNLKRNQNIFIFQKELIKTFAYPKSLDLTSSNKIQDGTGDVVFT